VGTPSESVYCSLVRTFSSMPAMKSWLILAAQRSVRQRALKVAAVVGPILTVINQGDVLLAGPYTAKTWLKIVLTFIVPYCVSTFASVQATRQLERDGG
jgi:hypothetical protein